MVRENDNAQNIFRSIDWFTIVVYLLLVAAGCISVIGASYNYGDTAILDFATRSGKQLIWIGCSLLLGLALLLTDDRIYDTFANVIYVVLMAILLITPFIATDHKGSYSWITLGPVSIQPAEFAKCATALALAKYMSSYGFSIHRSRDFIRAISIVILPIILIILQHETGSALVYLAFFFVFYREGMSGSVLFIGFATIVYFVVGLRYELYPLPYTLSTIGSFSVLLLIWVFTGMFTLIYSKTKADACHIFIGGTAVTAGTYLVSRYLIAFDISWCQLAICLAAAAFLCIQAIRRRASKLALIALFTIGSLAMHYSTNSVFNNLASHQQVRIQVLLGLKDDINGAGYNVRQSEIAIGSGGLYGKGFLNGTQTKLKYVPEQDTDFIYCTVGEEFGFVGSAIVLLLFLTLILRLIALAERQPYAFGRIYGYCLLSIFLFHMFINVGMVLGLTPVIGIPLPFFSYGGSSLWGFTLLLFIFLRIDAGREKFRH